MKDKRQKQKQKAKIIREKLIQKKEHIQNIRKDLEKKRKKLENKIAKTTQKQEIFENKKELNFNKMRRTRNELFKKIRINKKSLEKEEVLRREDILFEENNKIAKLYNSPIAGKTEIDNIQSKTLILSKEDYLLRKEFLKKMYKLKAESVSNKSFFLNNLYNFFKFSVSIFISHCLYLLNKKIKSNLSSIFALCGYIPSYIFESSIFLFLCFLPKNLFFLHFHYPYQPNKN